MAIEQNRQDRKGEIIVSDQGTIRLHLQTQNKHLLQTKIK